MRTSHLVVACLAVLLSTPALAELQNVEVGGKIRIRWNHFSPEGVAGQVRPGLGLLDFGNPVGAQFSEPGNSLSFVEQRTQLNVTADFTKNVTAFIELDSYDWWGEDFRSEYITGDERFPDGDVEIYQAYIETRDTWGIPLRLRIGRQELQFGSEWLVGNNDTSSLFSGLSFDGIRADYLGENFSVAAFATKLSENSPIEEDSDVDFYGIYASYTGVRDMVFDAYWLFLRDGRGSRLGFPFATPNDGLFGRIEGRIENYFGVDGFEPTQHIHTWGVRFAGMRAGFDWEAEVAYQGGDATNTIQRFFNPDPDSNLVGLSNLPFGGPYGDDDVDYTGLLWNAELGYTFDLKTQPRLYIGAAYFQGQDERDDTFKQWHRNTFILFEQDTELSVNRLFSDWEYSEFLDNGNLSNAMIYRGGFSLTPMERLELLLTAAYFRADEVATSNGRLGIPWLGYKSDFDLGWELGVYLSYDYTEDLVFNFGYAHFFAGDGVDRVGRFPRLFPRVGGNFVANNGLTRVGGVDQDDADYFFAETAIRF